MVNKMNDFFDEINKLVREIVNHNVDSVQTQIRIDELKKKYGEDVFPSIYFEEKPLPWDESYLRELREKNVTGACSEEFLLHMAKVSDYLFEKKHNKWTIVVGILIAFVIISMILYIGGGRGNGDISNYERKNCNWVDKSR